MSTESYRAEYANSWALVVGIDAYKDSRLPPLMTAVKGARAFADLLRQEFDFPADHVILLENEKATQAAIRRAFTDPLGRRDKVSEDDRVVVYFGGHGVTYDTAEGEIGCVTTYDTEAAYWDTTIPMDELTRLANRSHAKHILFLLDACFSGYATTRSTETGVSRQTESYLTRAARQVISAGMRDQMVSDTFGPDGHSLFTGFLLEGLHGAAPAPGGVLRAFHLAGYLQDMVGQHSRSQQTPQYAALLGSQGGDFIFAMRPVAELSEMLQIAITNKDPAQRLSAVAQLRKITLGQDTEQAAQALSKLQELTADPDAMVRSSARGALRELVPKTSIVPVVREKLLAIVSTPQVDTVEMPSPVRRRAFLHIVGGPAQGSRFEVDADGGIIGRASDNWLSFPNDGQLSRRHARIEWQGPDLLLTDLGSTNGTLINDQPVTGPTLIQSGDRIALGLTVCRVIFPAEASKDVDEETKKVLPRDVQHAEEMRPPEATVATPVATQLVPPAAPTRSPITAEQVPALQIARLWKEHLEEVTSVAWSPDGTRLAAGFNDRTVMVWDAQGTLLRTLRGHAQEVTDVEWSPDGVRLASSSRDGTISIWDTTTGQRLRVIKGPTGLLSSVAWSHDGALLGVGSRDGTVLVWDAATGEQRHRLAAHTNVANDVEWSPDGLWLASCASDKTALIWEVAIGEWRHVLEGHTQAVRCLAWSPDGQRLATGSSDDTILIWQVATGKSLRKLDSHKSEVASLAWSPNGALLASGSADGVVAIWDAHSGAMLRELGGVHLKVVTGLDWSPDGTRLASCSLDRQIAVWEAAKEADAPQ